MKTVEFALPWAPSINHYWKHRVIGKRAQVYISKEGNDFIKSVNEIIGGNPAIPFFCGRLCVGLVLNPPTLRKYDIDNRIKATFDALTKANLWVDDEQIDSLIVIRGLKVEGGQVLVRVTEV
jgi:crossover junction endodeoxyribonuclease RusA